MTEPNLWLSWAAIAANRQQFQSAAGYARRALHLAPGDPEVLAHLAAIQFRMKKYDHAAEALEEAQRSNPQSWMIAYILAVTKFALFDLAASKELFAKAVADAPDERTRRALAAEMAYPVKRGVELLAAHWAASAPTRQPTPSPGGKGDPTIGIKGSTSFAIRLIRNWKL